MLTELFGNYFIMAHLSLGGEGMDFVTIVHMKHHSKNPVLVAHNGTSLEVSKISLAQVGCFMGVRPITQHVTSFLLSIQLPSFLERTWKREAKKETDIQYIHC